MRSGIVHFLYFLRACSQKASHSEAMLSEKQQGVLFQVSHLPACLRRTRTTPRLLTLVWATAWSARSPTNSTPSCSRSTPTPERSPPRKKVLTHTHLSTHNRTHNLDMSVGKSIICPSLPVICQYSDTVNPDYTAHLVLSRLMQIGGRLPKCVAWCWSLIALSVCEHVNESEDALSHLCTARESFIAFLWQETLMRAEMFFL